MKKTGITVLIAFCCIAGNAQSNFSSARLDSFFTSLEKNNKAMGSFVIREDGKTVYARATGFIDAKKTPANSSTVYRLGSISKMYTAALTFLLIQEGKLSMNTPLSAFFPEIPNAATIQIHHLLGHTSGIYNITDDSTYGDWYTQMQTRTQMVNRIKASPTQFAPGSRKQYSNSNYILLGYIIEAVTKKPYSEALQQRINTVTGAKATKYGGKINTGKNEAASFSFQEGKWVQEKETDMSVPHGAGAVTATAADVALFAEKYIGGGLLNTTWTDTVTQFKKQLGYGIMKFPMDKTTVGLGHNGAIDGFNTIVMYHPGKKISMAFLSNGINYSIESIFDGAWKIFTGKDFSIPTFTTVQLTDADLAKYKGVYSAAAIGLSLTIDSKDGTMLVQATGQPQFSMDSESATVFSNGQIGATLEFKVQPDGTVKEMLLKQGGGEVTFIKEK